LLGCVDGIIDGTSVIALLGAVDGDTDGNSVGTSVVGAAVVGLMEGLIDWGDVVVIVDESEGAVVTAGIPASGDDVPVPDGVVV
jgi:hypothetical protein